MTAAEPLFREAAEIGRRIPGASPEKVNGLLHYARLVQQFDRNPQRAEPIDRDALGLARSLYPQDHQDTATILGELARDVRDPGTAVRGGSGGARIDADASRDCSGPGIARR